MSEVRRSLRWSWTGRDGSRNSVAFDIGDGSDTTIAKARAYAVKMGYPGHAGGFWNYLLGDIRATLAKQWR